MQIAYEMSGETRAMVHRLSVSAGELGRRFLAGARVVAQELADDALDTAQSRLHQRSGNLYRGIQGRAYSSGDQVVIGVGVIRGPATPYAGIQDQSGTVRARPGHALPVPIGNRTAVTKSPSQLPNSIRRKLILIERPGKPPLLCLKLGRSSRTGFSKGAGLQPMYVLVRHVKIPGTKYLTDTIWNRAPRRIGDMLDGAFQETLK